MSKDTVSSVSKDVAEDFAALRADVAKLATLVSDLARTQAETARAGAVEAYGSARNRLQGAADILPGRAVDTLRGTSDEIGAMVERNPVTTILLAVLGGLLLGLVSRPRSQ